MNLKLTQRELTGKKVHTLREEGLVPASIYGPNRESTNVVVSEKDFDKVFYEAGYNGLVEAELDGKTTNVLIKEVQSHPTRQDLIHVSLYEVDMNKTLTTDIPIEVEGVSPAVKTNIGILVQPLNNLKVTCLPKDLPHEYVVNIDGLDAVGKTIKIKDIELGEGVELPFGVNPNATVVFVAPPQKRIVLEDETEGAEGEGEGAEGEGEAAAE